MRRLKLAVMVLVAVCASFALTVAVASGATMLLPGFMGANQGFTGKSGKGILSSGGIKITCLKDTNKGGMENSKLGTFTIDFTECTTVGGLVKCNSLADASETILTSGSWHLVLTTVSGVDKRLFWFLPVHLHLECGSTLSLVLGSLLGLILPEANTLTKVYQIDVNVVGGNQEFTKFEDDNGTLVNASLTSAINEKGEEGATEESAENFVELENAVEILN